LTSLTGRERIDAEVLHGEVAALLRRFYALTRDLQLVAAEAIVGFLGAYELTGSATVREQVDALRVLAAAAEELALPRGTAPTAREFNASAAAHDSGWNATRVGRAFGRWGFATDRLLGRPIPQSAEQRSAIRLARRGVFRQREDYLCGLRLWLDTGPATTTTYDYDAWRADYNEQLPLDEPRLVSYSMLRKAFQCDWADLLSVARGALSLEAAEARTRRGPLAQQEGPHGLIGRDLIHQLAKIPVADKRTIRAMLSEDLRLTHRDISETDRILDEQEAALAAIRAVARKLNLQPGEWPTIREFDDHAGPGCTRRRVIDAFGRWSIAIAELNGLSRQTAEQLAYLRQVAGRDLAKCDPMESVREWLASDPQLFDRHSYDRWVRCTNTSADRGDRSHLGSITVIQRLGLTWSWLVKVARGEVSAEDAPQRTGREKPTWSSGPHIFLGRREVAARLGLDYQRSRRLEGQADFPPPGIVLGNTPAWLNTQIDDYIQGKSSSPLDHNALRDSYLNAQELAERLHVTPAALRQPGAHAPKPTGAICGKHIWHLPAVEKWEAQTDKSPYSGRARKAPVAGS
jgi:hypothetical protein